MFEAEEEIDWGELDRTYDLVIGGPDEYVNTVIENYEQLRTRVDRVQSRLADVARADFTNIKALRGIGSLYLRRAETRRGPEPLLDCKKAYAAFQACRVLEEAWYEMELPTTSFRLAKSIMLGVTTAGNKNPFGPSPYPGRNMIAVAESKAQRAVSNSIGNFHLEARRLVSDISRIRRTLV
jgi:hypothetical protein